MGIIYSYTKFLLSFFISSFGNSTTDSRFSKAVHGS